MITGQDRLPYWRLSGFYFFYFAFLGAWIPYWSLYLENMGYSAKAIGLISSIVLGTKIIAPSIWGWLADQKNQRMKIIRQGALLAFVCFLGVFIDFGLGWLVVVIAVFSFFWNAILAQFEVITLSHLDNHHRYSQIRLWGSVGFIATVAGFGYVFDVVSIDYLPWMLAILLASIWLSSLFVVEKIAPHTEESTEGLRSILRKPAVIAFFVCCFLLQVGHGPYYTFFSIYLEDFGYSRAMIGQLWGLGVLAEVVLFVFMHRLLSRFSIRHILLVTLLLACLRWLLIAYLVDNLLVLLFAQCLHAATFGSFHAVAIELVRRFFKGGHEGQGQAIYSSVSFGAGGAVGALISGWYWDSSASSTFLMASAVSLLALLISFFWLQDAKLVEKP